MKGKVSALFLDRDGVINRMVLYPDGWDSPRKTQDVRLTHGVIGIIKWARERLIPVIEISNQPGVAKGKMDQEMARAVQKKVEELLIKEAAKLDGVYICPHHPKGIIKSLTKKCDCRKPKPGLLIRAAKERGIDLKSSVFLGDKESDVRAGKAAGCKTILYLHNEDKPKKVKDSLLAEADFRIGKIVEVKKVLENWRLYKL